MFRRISIAALGLLLSSASHAASVNIVPSFQIAFETCVVHVNASHLSGIKGLDIDIAFNRDLIRCTSVLFTGSTLPGFSEFYRKIDNESGRFEIVLLKQSRGGFTGDAPSVLTLTFEPVSNGTSLVYVRKSYQWGDPLLIDNFNTSIEAEVDTARVMVFGHEPVPAIPAVSLHQNYPNPFNPGTTIRFDIPWRMGVRLKIYDASGKLVRTLIDGTQYEVGTWDARWDGKNDRGNRVPSGVYFCALNAGGKSVSRKLILLR